MNFILLITIVVPITIAILSKIVMNRQIDFLEMVAIAVITIIPTFLIYEGTRYSGSYDTELLNGEIIAKKADQRNCPVGWRTSTDGFCTEYKTREVYDGDICFTDKDGNKSCTPQYHTEYKYYFSWERRYFVWTSLKTSYEIAREDRQGEIYPASFIRVQVGDPAAIKHSYNNWLIAASNNLFSEDGEIEEKYKDMIPAYPIRIYDQHLVDRLIVIGNVSVPSSINTEIGNALKELGPKRQMNLVLVVADTNVVGEDYPYALRKAWKGFKKNDAVVFLGVNGDKLAWVNVLSWSKNELFNVNLRENITKVFKGKSIDYSRIVAGIKAEGLQTYERRSMKEFEYLKSEIPTPTWVICLVVIFSFGGPFILIRIFSKTELLNAILGRIR